MDEISESEAPTPTARRRPDLLTALMAGFTVIFLVGTLWMRYGPAPQPNPPVVGADAPGIVLVDPWGEDPNLFLGLRGKVVWLTFWSGRSPGVVDTLESIWRRHGGHRMFSMIAAAEEGTALTEIRSLQQQRGWSLPVYRAAATTRFEYGVQPELIPMHFLLDDGKILASSLDFPTDPVGELENRLRSRLQELDPGGSMRYAQAVGPRPQSGTGVVVGASLR